jgi:uncharacterized membrane protein YphA (DoxX/SURF4 family)
VDGDRATGGNALNEADFQLEMANNTTTVMTAETTSHAAMSSEPKARSIGCCLPHVARILFGLVFFVFGLNGFIQFIPQPKSAMSEEAMSFAGALMKTDYMHALIFGTQVTAGALLLLNRFVPLALANILVTAVILWMKS